MPEDKVTVKSLFGALDFLRGIKPLLDKIDKVAEAWQVSRSQAINIILLKRSYLEIRNRIILVGTRVKIVADDGKENSSLIGLCGVVI